MSFKDGRFYDAYCVCLGWLSAGDGGGDAGDGGDAVRVGVWGCRIGTQEAVGLGWLVVGVVVEVFE